jgi:hypothetical protein
MIRNIIAGVVGVFVALAIIALNEKIGHLAFPPPADIDFSDPDIVEPYLASLPAWALLQVMAGWVIGVFAGILAATTISLASTTAYTLVIGGLIFAATVANLIIIPHPMWFNVTGLAAIALSAWFAKTIADKNPARVSPE